MGAIEQGAENWWEDGLRRSKPQKGANAEWAILEPLIPKEKPSGCPRKVDMHAVQSAHLLHCAGRLRQANVAV